MKITASKQTYSGALFIAIGIATFLASRMYELGTITRMGPGYLPAAIGIMLVVFGAGTILSGRSDAEKLHVDRSELLSLFYIILGIVIFAFVVEPAGLAVGIAVLVISSCYGRIREHPIEVFSTFLILLLISSTIFIYALDMPLSVLNIPWE